jgi:hypothetical protein
MSANRLAALTGVAFLVLVVLSTIVVGDAPDPKDDGPLKIIQFYKDKDSEVYISALLSALAATALVFFAGYLGKVLRAASGPGHMLSWIPLAGAAIVATGAGLDATINVALVEEVDHIQPAAVQALSALWSNDWVPFVIGGTIFMLSAGLSIVRHGGLPRWMGWIAIALAVVSATPAGFVGFIGAGLWVAVASVLLFLRADEPGATGAMPPPVATTPA